MMVQQFNLRGEVCNRASDDKRASSFSWPAVPGSIKPLKKNLTNFLRDLSRISSTKNSIESKIRKFNLEVKIASKQILNHQLC